MGSLAWTSYFLRNQFTSLPYPEHSFAGKTVIVTGSNVGLGFEAATHHVHLGAEKVILAVRSPEKGEEAKKTIEERTKRRGVVDVWQLDMSSYQSIQDFAKKAQSLSRIDVLLENAGLVPTGFSTAEGSEICITVNVYGTFLLALLMIPILRKSGQKNNNVPTLTIVSSDTHHMTPFKEGGQEDIVAYLDNEKFYPGGEERYATSKIMELYYVREFCSRHTVDSLGVTMNVVNPGLCWSALGRHMTWLQQLQLTIMRTFLARTTEVGSRTLVFATTGGPESHGMHSADCKFDDKAVRRFVRSEEGKKIQEKVYAQISAKLKSIRSDLFDDIPGGQ